MAGTYSQIHIQVVFAVKNHQSSFIKKEHKDEIEKYIAGIIANNNCKVSNRRTTPPQEISPNNRAATVAGRSFYSRVSG